MSQTGKMFINGLCAWTQWGAYLGDGSISALLAPPPVKSIIKNDNRTDHGVEVTTKNKQGLPLMRYGERNVTLYFCITADNYQNLFERQTNLFEVLRNGEVLIQISELPGVVFRLIYQDVSQYSQFNGEMAKFSVKFIEPNPTNRTV